MDLAKRTMGAALREGLVAMSVLNDDQLTLYQYWEIHEVILLQPWFLSVWRTEILDGLTNDSKKKWFVRMILHL